MKNPEEALNKLTGEVHALYLFSQVIGRTHPTPNSVLDEFEIASQQGLAFLEPHTVSESVISAYRDVVKALQQALQSNPHYK